MDRRPPGYAFSTSSYAEQPYSGSLRTEASPPVEPAPAPGAPEPNTYRAERPVRLSYSGDNPQFAPQSAVASHHHDPANAQTGPAPLYSKTTTQTTYVSSRDTPLAPDGRANSPGISGDSQDGEGSGDEYEFVEEEELPPIRPPPPKAAKAPKAPKAPKVPKNAVPLPVDPSKPVKEARPPPTQREFKAKVKKIKLKPGEELVEEIGPPELDADGNPIPGTERKVSHARKTAPGHIKRPPNAFILFRSHCCAPNVIDSTTGTPGTPSTQQLADLGITDHRHISRIVSHLWKSLPAHEKKYWDTKAQEKKEEHQRMYPDYRYKPVYRNKDEVRKRRKGADLDVEEEKRGCEQVALALLGPAEQAAAKERWTIDTVAAAVHNGENPPAVKKVKRARKKSKRVESPPIDEYEYAREMVAMEDMRAGSASNDAAHVLYQASQRSTQVRPREGEDDYSMYQAEQGSSKRTKYVPNPYPSESNNSPRRVPPPLNYAASTIPYNPSFQYYPTASDNNQSLKQHYERYSPARQPSPEALGSMQRYSFGGPPKPSPLAHRAPSPTIVESGIRGSPSEPSHPLPSARSLSFPTPVLYGRDHPVFAGMQRRGTFTRTSDGGNLMLVSPRGGGRTFSLAKWDVNQGEGPDQSEAQRFAQEHGQSTPIGGQFPEARLTAFAFDRDFLSAAQASLNSAGLDKGFHGARQANGEPIVDNRQAQSIDALLAASDSKPSLQYPDGPSDLAQFRAEGMSAESAAALDILIRSQLRVAYQYEGMENRTTVFLTVPQASEPMLVDRILKKGFSIVYDHVEPA